jgi:hypothetical protein
MPTVYDEQLARLKSFIASLKPTKILFLYFDIDGRKPQVKSWFGELPLENKEYYVIHGNDDNFVYAYEKSHMMAFVKMTNVDHYNPQEETHANIHTGYAYNVEISMNSKDVPVYVGDHIDFSIHRQRDMQTLVKSHSTTYNITDAYSASRDADACNFKLTPEVVSSLNGIKTFATVRCLDRKGNPLSNTCHRIYDENLDIVFHLTRVVSGLGSNTYHGGCRGGSFIIQRNRRQYIKRQLGGAASFSDNEQQDDKIQELIVDFLIDPVRARLGKRFANVSIIYDQHHADNRNALFIYSHGDNQMFANIFHVDLKPFYEASVVVPVGRAHPFQVIENIRDKIIAHFVSVSA